MCALFKVSAVGTVVGCCVTEGKITRNLKYVIRQGIVVHEGEIASLKEI